MPTYSFKFYGINELILLFCFVLIYLVATIWETLIHWKVLHASRQDRYKWKYYGGPFNLMRKAFFSHNIIHHRQTFNVSYFIQFNNITQKRLLDSKLKNALGRRIIRNRYGLTVSAFWEICFFTFVPVFSALFLFYWLAPKYILLGIFVSILPALLSKYVHPLLHVKSNRFDHEFNTFYCWLSGTVYFRYIQHYHYLHHKHGLCNFNLLPGGDYLLGVWKHEEKITVH